MSFNKLVFFIYFAAISNELELIGTYLSLEPLPEITIKLSYHKISESLISNNSELAAKYLSNEVEELNKTLEIKNINNSLFQGSDLKKEENIQAFTEFLEKASNKEFIEEKVNGQSKEPN